MTTPQNDGKKRREVERAIYLILVVGLAVYGLWNSETAVSLINAIREAFSILF